MHARVFAASFALAISGTASAEDWQWSVTPYLWATDVGIDASLHDRELVDATIPFADLVEDLETGLLLRAQAMHGQNGVALDLFDVVVADDGGHSTLPGNPAAELSLDAEVGLTLFDLTGVHAFRPDGTGLSVVYGTRVIRQSADLEARIVADGATEKVVRHDVDDTYFDALVGLRYDGTLAGHWSYQIAADVSTGNTDFTWSVNPSLDYTFGEKQQYQVIAGYRYLIVQFDTAPAVDLQLTMSGFLAGFRFNF